MCPRLMTRRHAVLWGAALLSGAALEPAIAQPRLVQAVLSDDESANQNEEVFAAASAQQLFVIATFADMPASAKVRCTWLRLTPAAQKLDSRELTLATQDSQVKFSYMPPTGMWPLGQYRVDLELDGVLLGSLPFRMS